ncbi:hypothetical protein [Sphingobium sp. CR28]|uniref:hypothetical protein n=1 Tax=Sphingobium sp. CR28 TaxID=3400272 RepID=UPI003FF0DA4C
MLTLSQRLLDWMGRSRFRGKRLVILAMAALFVLVIPFIFLFVVVPAFAFGFVSQAFSRFANNRDERARAARA